MKQFLAILLFFPFFCVQAQLNDDFTDGDFTTNPSWSGTSADFVVNATKELQSNLAISATSYLSTPHGLTNFVGKEWHYNVKQTFAGSASNYGKIYLSATSADLSTNPDGIFLLLGEALSTDAIRLFKRVGGVNTQLLATVDGTIATTMNATIKITRDVTSTWSLFVDLAGGTNYTLVGSIVDPIAFTGTHTGYLCVYTSGNANNFYLDNVYAGNIIVDMQSPTLVSITNISANQVDLKFSEGVLTSTIIPPNFDGNPFFGNPSAAALDVTDNSLVHLTFANNFANGTTYQITAFNIQDLAGNVTTSQFLSFTYLVNEVSLPGDIIITEFFPDPSPKIGLPEIEFVEIYNKSSKYFNVNTWRLGDGATEGTIQNGWIYPGQYKVLCTTSAVDSFPNGVAVTSFPSLNNAGDNVVIRNNLGTILDQLTYTDDWYQDLIKKNGGYTLELINANDPCSGADNWKASNSSNGGTPGNQNSINDNTPDTQAPQISQVFTLPPDVVQIQFNEGMDPLSLSNATITFQPALSILTTSVGFNNSLNVTLTAPFVVGTFYTITIAGATDCWGNTTILTGQFAQADNAIAGDLVINEILFDPVTGGQDFVEIYNNSSKLIDVFGLEFANFDNDTIDNKKQCTTHKFILPGEYIAFSKDTLHLINQYPFTVKGQLIQMDLPSYNVDSSTVYLINVNQILDKVSYDKSWHFKLLDNFDGKTLERVDANATSQDKTNWFTAAEATNFGTPGKENSQKRGLNAGDFTFESTVVSPDNDGYEDLLFINYQMAKPGMVAKMNIYNDQGVKIKELLNNELLATEGRYTWDGLSDKNTKASIGAYVLVFEAFEANGGEVFSKRKAFVVAGKL
jgi:Lamin Tail Domain